MLRGIKKKIKITCRGTVHPRTREVDAMVYGNLAIQPAGCKIPLNGRDLNAYFIIHVPSGRYVHLVAGHNNAKFMIEELLKVDSFECKSLTDFSENNRLIKILRAVTEIATTIKRDDNAKRKERPKVKRI